MAEDKDALPLGQGNADITDRGLLKGRAGAVGMGQVLYAYDCHAALRCKTAAAMASAHSSV